MSKLKLSDQPVAYAEVVKSILAAVVVLGLVHLSGVQVAGIERCVTAVLGIIVWTQVTPNAHVDQKVDAAVTAKEQEIHSFLADAQLAAVSSEPPAVPMVVKDPLLDRDPRSFGPPKGSRKR